MDRRTAVQLTKQALKLTTAAKVTDDDIKKIAKMTDQNDHTGARAYIAANILKDKKLARAFEGVADIGWFLMEMPRELLTIRDQILTNENLKPQLERKLSPEDYERVWGAL